MAWSVAGNVLIACNCDFGCPCNFNALPTHGACEGGWIWIIEKGHVDDVRLDGIGVGLFAKWPGAIHDGGGRAVDVVDGGDVVVRQQPLQDLAPDQPGSARHQRDTAGGWGRAGANSGRRGNSTGGLR